MVSHCVGGEAALALVVLAVPDMARLEMDAAMLLRVPVLEISLCVGELARVDASDAAAEGCSRVAP